MMRVLVNWLLFILLFISGGRLNNALNEDANTTVTGSCIEKERQALLIFKAYAKGFDRYLVDWGKKRDCCQWRGVSCNNHTGHVIELYLSFTGLVDKISPSLKLLKQLQFLSLSGLDFQSNHIPKVLGSLTNLQHLDISGANLSVPIPHQLGNLSDLLYLDLSGNSLVGPIPHQLGNLSKLLHLDLSRNSLGGSIPFSFGALTYLTYLNLAVNQLGGAIPNSFENCSSLIQLYLSENFLNGSVPSFAGCSSSVEELFLHRNTLQGGVPNFTRWSSLTILSLADNSLNGSIPDFTGCESLVELDLSRNQFSDLPNILGQVSNLKCLDVSSNSLNCVISDLHFENLSRLTHLDMSFNSLAFELSSLFRVPFQLKTIKLHSCKLGPSFPLWIKTQTNFNHLDISRAGISYGVPVWFWDLPFGLVSLNLSLNKLHGELPKDIGRLKSLDVLDLSRNQFSENIPSNLSQVDRLGYLNLSFNNFAGRIPLGTQLQSFNSSSYEGNPLLYGPPLTPPPAPTVVEKEEDEKHGDDDFWKSYYMGMGAGFAVGFWGICGTIFLNRQCRHLLFASLSLAKDWIYVRVVVLFRKLKRF